MVVATPIAVDEAKPHKKTRRGNKEEGKKLTDYRFIPQSNKLQYVWVKARHISFGAARPPQTQVKLDTGILTLRTLYGQGLFSRIDLNSAIQMLVEVALVSS